MGRVEDAMRRAAEEADRRGHTAASLVVADERAAEALAAEPYPDEGGPVVEVRADEELIDASTPLDPGPVPAVSDVSSTIVDATDRFRAGKLVGDTTMPQPIREQYRRLAGTLLRAQEETGLKVVMVASAVASEGKTLTATNLALTFSESYRRSVLLIDGDLRRPSVHKLFRLEDSAGLSEGLTSPDPQKFILHQTTDYLTILPAGRPTSDPMAGLTSSRMRGLVSEARERFDWVIIDTPPIGLMTDANLLAAMADGTLLVVKAGSTSYQMAQRAIEAIGRDRFLGAVLNRADVETYSGHRYYYNYYYGQYGARGGQPTLRHKLLGRFWNRDA